MDEKKFTLTAGNIHNIDDEIASMRLEIISILKNDPRNYRTLRRALTRYARLLCQQHFLNNTATSMAVATAVAAVAAAAAIIEQFIDYVIPTRPEYSRRGCFSPV